MAYVTVKGGEQAIDNAHAWLAEERRGDPTVPELSLAQIEGQLGRSVDRAMGEGSLYDRELAALAVKQAQGDLIEAAFLLRAYRTTLPRFAHSLPVDTAAMQIRRRISAVFKDLPGGQVLGPTYDYTHRLLDFGLADGGGDVAGAAHRRGDAGDAARARHPRPRGADRSPTAPAMTEPGDLTREPLTFPGIARRAAAGAGARRRRLPAGTRLFDAARLRRHASVRRRDPHGRGVGGDRTAGTGLRHRHRRHHRHRMPDGQPVQGLEDHAAAVHPRLWAGVRLLRAQGDGDGTGRSRHARGGTGRGGDRAGTERRVRAVPLGQHRGDRLRRASEAAALRRFPERAAERAARCDAGRGPRRVVRRSGMETPPPLAGGVGGGGVPCPSPTPPAGEGSRDEGLQLRLSGRADEADDPPRAAEGGGDPGPSGAVRLARDAAALWLGHRRHPGHRIGAGRRRRAEGDRPGRR